MKYEAKMKDQSTLQNCLSGLSELACITRIDEVMNLDDLLIPACMFFMTVAAIGSIVELSSKIAGERGVFKSILSLTLSVYLAFIPLGAYSIDVFSVELNNSGELKRLSWFHKLKELGIKHNA
jgi:hypothetical protein